VASSLTTEAILEAIRKRLIRMCPRDGWTPYVFISINVKAHGGEIVDPPEVNIKDKTRDETTENDAES